MTLSRDTGHAPCDDDDMTIDGQPAVQAALSHGAAPLRGGEAPLRRSLASLPVPWVLTLAVTSVCALATIPLVLVSVRQGTEQFVGEWIFVTFTPGFAVAGWWLLSRRPGMWIGRLYLVAGLTTAVTGLAAGIAGVAYPDHGALVTWSMWVVSWLWLVHDSVITVVVVLFPRRVPRGRLDRLLIGIVAVSTGVSMLAAALRPGLIVTTPDNPGGAPVSTPNPVGIPGLKGIVNSIGGSYLVLGLALNVVILGLIATRWWRASGIERRQYRWVFLLSVGSSLVLPLVVVFPVWIGPFVAVTTTFAFQMLVVVAILKWDVYEAGVVLRRSALAAALLAVALGVYGAVVVVTAVAVGGFGPLPATVGAMVAVFAFGPLSLVVRRRVNRLFYGRRDDPYSVLASVGRGQAEASDADDALDRLLASICAELRLPGAAVRAADGDVLALVGDADLPAADRLELRHLGERVGTLQIAARRGTDGLTEADRPLLNSLADAIAAVVAARRAADHLQVARDRLLIAQDEERSRYQRDLHDGLGPRLTSVVFKLDAISNHLNAGRPDTARVLADDARAELRDGVDEIRTYINQLGDQVVAASGLRDALLERIASLTSARPVDMRVTIGDLGALSAAIESAVLAVACEAVTNVLRHTAARTCCVELRRDRDLLLTISDDGGGLGSGFTPGVGVGSMRHRIERLGGRFDIASGDGGATVSCLVPVS